LVARMIANLFHVSRMRLDAWIVAQPKPVSRP
jgi:hypothetical protein